MKYRVTTRCSLDHARSVTVDDVTLTEVNRIALCLDATCKRCGAPVRVTVAEEAPVSGRGDLVDRLEEQWDEGD